jgi:hypothetical protein
MSAFNVIVAADLIGDIAKDRQSVFVILCPPVDL